MVVVVVVKQAFKQGKQAVRAAVPVVRIVALLLAELLRHRDKATTAVQGLQLTQAAGAVAQVRLEEIAVRELVATVAQDWRRQLLAHQLQERAVAVVQAIQAALAALAAAVTADRLTAVELLLAL